MPSVTTTILGTGIVQYSMSASAALAVGLLTKDKDCRWFAEWAQKSPSDAVYAYSFGGVFGGFIYGEAADFYTLAEFADSAAVRAEEIWTGYILEANAYLDRNGLL